jgi:tetratricopeptide (TPR) repeat protein
MPILLSALTLSLSQVALAAKLPEVAVVGVHVEGLDATAGEAAAVSIGEAIERGGTLTWVEPQRVSARIKGREELIIADMALRDGKVKLEEGRVLYERAQPDQAIPLLQRATEDLREGIAATGRTTELIEAYLLLGIAHYAMGEEDAARAAYRQVVILDPGRELDPISYPPPVIALFDGVRKEVLGAGVGTLNLNGSDASVPVSITVDGRPLGVGPLSAERLPAGTHHIFAIAEGGRRSYTAVELKAGETLDITVPVAQVALGVPGETSLSRSAQIEPLYRSIGEHADSTLVLLAGEIGGEKVAVQLYSPRTKSFSKALVADAGDDPVAAMVDLIPSLTGYVNEAGDLRPDRVSIDIAPLDLDSNAVLTQILLDPNEELQIQYIESDNSRWWLWTGVGAIVAGGGAATAVLLTRGEPEDNGVIILGPLP